MIERILGLVLGFLIAGSMPVLAQEIAHPDAPSKAEVLAFLDLMDSRARMVQVLEGMEKQARLGAEAGFKQQIPNATPAQLAKVDALFDGIFKDFSVDEMVDAIVPIYQKHLSRQDLAAITEFYRSPVGQRVLKEMPAIMSEAMEAGGEVGRRSFEIRSHQLDQKIADLVKEMKSN